MGRYRDHARRDRSLSWRRMPVPMGAAWKLTVVEVKRAHVLEDSLVGERLDQPRTGSVAREVKAGRVEVARIDQQAEALRRRSHIPQQSRQFVHRLAELAALARVFDQQARAGR